MAKSLMEFADCAGCASKLAAGELAQVLSDIPRSDDPRVLVDYRTADDAGVYRWPGGPALVQTVDFFTPIVDDPYAFGQIAAANALSDVYAMGGIPRTALAVAAFPKNEPGPDVIKAIFRGGFDKLREANVALLGGHTVSDQEVKFGYAITGEIDPDRVLTNANARQGDVLVLTKALGTGIITRASKFGRATPAQLEGAVRSMCTLNRDAAAAITSLALGIVSACTDVTGFGLAGHGSEIAAANGTTLEIEAAALPILEGALELAIENMSCGGRANQRHFMSRVAIADDVPMPLQLLCLDPQTSGGLLVAVDPASVPTVIGRLAKHGVIGRTIGRVGTQDPGGLLVKIG
jgi:selenide,water dikinase